MLKELEKTVVNLRTQEEFNEYMQMCEDAGWLRVSNKKPTEAKVFWNDYKENTCVEVMDRFRYGSKAYFESEGYKNITLKELKNIMESQTLKEGDLLYNEQGGVYARILGVCGKAVFISETWERGGKEYTTSSSSIYSISELKEYSWKVVPESHLTEEPAVVVDGKKYKKSDIDALQPIAE